MLIPLTLAIMLSGCDKVQVTNENDLKKIQEIEGINITKEYKEAVRGISDLYVNLECNGYGFDPRSFEIERYESMVADSLYGNLKSELDSLKYELEYKEVGEEEIMPDEEDTEEDIVTLEELMAKAYESGEDSKDHQRYLAWRRNEDPEVLAESDRSFEEYIKYMSIEQRAYYTAIREGLNPPEGSRPASWIEGSPEEVEELMEYSLEELKKAQAENQEKYTLELLYEAYYSDVAILRYGNMDNMRITLNVYGNNERGIEYITVKGLY